MEQVKTDPAALDAVQKDAEIDHHLERLADLRASVRRNDAVAAARADQIETWRQVENERLEAEIARREHIVADFARGYDFGSKKSRNLPHGTFGFRAIKPRIVVSDKDALLEWARSECPESLKVSESVPASVYKSYVETTGEIPPGVEVEELSPEELQFGRFYTRTED